MGLQVRDFCNQSGSRALWLGRADQPRFAQNATQCSGGGGASAAACGGDRRLRRREVVGRRRTGGGFRGSQPVRRQLPADDRIGGRARCHDLDRHGFCCHRSHRVNRVRRHRSGRRRRLPRRAADRPGARRCIEDGAGQDAAPGVDLHGVVHLGSGRPAQRSQGHDTLATCSATCPRLPGCVGRARCDLRSGRGCFHLRWGVRRHRPGAGPGRRRLRHRTRPRRCPVIGGLSQACRRAISILGACRGRPATAVGSAGGHRRDRR